MKKFIVGFFVVLFMVGCIKCMEGCIDGPASVANEKVFNLPIGEKLVMVSGDGSPMYFITRSMHEGEVAETYKVFDVSGGDIQNTGYTIVEKR